MYISYEWDEGAHNLNWGIHDGKTYIKRGFKTRKAARKWCDENGVKYVK
jgi:hypothetical protein